MDEQRLGRLIEEDDRDYDYPLTSVLKPAEPGVTYRYWWAGGAWLNQGPTGTCVGHAWAHWVEDGPITHEGTIDPFNIYYEATQRDAWPGNDNGDLQFGTSVRAAVKYLKEATRVTEYRWAFTLQATVQTLLTAGPVVIGSWWYETMSRPDREGNISVGGDRVGGHAYVLNGVNTERQIIRMKNSWGRGWGKNGYAYLTFDDVDRLIGERGEVCLALETETR